MNSSKGDMARQTLLSVEQVAERLNVPIATVYQWNHLGTGPRRIKIGRHVRYRPEDVEAWISANVVSDTA